MGLVVRPVYEAGSGHYANGTLVSMTARAAIGATFSAWSGDSVTALSQITLRMDSDKRVAANFTSNASLDVNVSGAGSVSGQALNGLHEIGANANLIAIPDTGWIFAGWPRTATNRDLTTSVLIDGPRVLNAKFEISIESWKTLHFAVLASDSSESGNSVNTDQDGQSNWQEYLYRSAPLDSSSTGRETISLSAGFLSMIYYRNRGSQRGAIVPRGSVDLSVGAYHIQ